METKGQPTEAQIKEFWEWCGFKWNDRIELWNDPIHGLISSILPHFDPNNLFKYAVPKLQSCTLSTILNDGYLCSANLSGKWLGVRHESDPALALFWAIWGVIHGS